MAQLQREGTLRPDSGPPPAAQSASRTPDDSDRPSAVQFADGPPQERQISAGSSIERVDTITANHGKGVITAKEQEELRNLSQTMRNTYLQQKRFDNGVFEPVSIPASRVPSSEGPSRQGSVTHRSPALAAITPPLSAASSHERHNAVPTHIHSEMTPQASEPRFPPDPTGKRIASRETSPGRGRQSSTTMGHVTPPTAWSRPSTPGAAGRDDPYVRSKRPPQSRNVDAVEARFKFDGRDSRRNSRISSPAAQPDQSIQSDKHHGGLLHGLGKHHHEHKENHEKHEKHSSVALDLKRFFRFGGTISHGKRSRANSQERPPIREKKTAGRRTPPGATIPPSVPFGDEHTLQSKYGKFGKVLGSGAGGSVRILKRSSDGVTFAVKQFRDRHPHESEREYNKKVTAEFCIGSTLHHGNIIETLDIIMEKSHWYEVMEFAPFDLFATVMTGKMSREEVACCFLQIVSGVSYLHSMGLAHRDLKLDNVVINEHGIMKIIDFGSAVVFKYPMESDIVLSNGIVGSDPYLAPEVYDNNKYNAAAVDIWSLAIIFACMSLRRFPWKAPRLTDNSYKLFVSPPTPGTQADIVTRKSSTERHVTPQTTTSSAQPAPAAGNTASKPKEPEVIKGPWRLLRLLPRESRNIISRMLEVDPRQRATLEDVLADPWVSTTPKCEQMDHGQVVKATNHTHTLEPGAAEAAPSKK